MNQPLVSVICLCYNHEKFVVKSLDSVINQSYKNIELIIVDDKSSDNSTTIINQWLEKYPFVTKVFNELNMGNTKAFNKAAKLAKGEYLIDLAADDILIENCIEKQVNCFENASTNTAIVFGNSYLINAIGERIGTYFQVDHNLKVIDQGLRHTNYERIIGSGTVICSVSAMMKRTVFDQLDGYNEQLSFEDLDYWFRAAREHNILFIDEFLVKKRVLSNSLGSQFHRASPYNKKLNQSLYVIIRETLKKNRTKKEHHSLLRRINQELFLAVKFFNISNIVRYTKLKIMAHFYVLFSK
nr:glycosyltransferase [uncultured Flavobacterium sp.]